VKLATQRGKKKMKEIKNLEKIPGTVGFRI